MKTSKSSTFGNFKITNKKKVWFLIPAVIAFLTAVMLIVFAFAADSPVNMGMDFAGGYSITVKSSTITEENIDKYEDKIEQLATSFKNDDGDEYSLKITEIKQIGADSGFHFNVAYKRIKGFSDDEMTEAGEAFVQVLKDLLMNVVPVVQDSGSDVIITYPKTMSAYSANIVSQIREVFKSAKLDWVNPIPDNPDKDETYVTKLKFEGAAVLDKQAIISAATIVDESVATVSDARKVSGSINTDLIVYSVVAAVIILFVAFAYFAIRFKSLSLGYTVVLGLLLDILMIFCFMMIFHIEITGLIIAAIAATIIYSLYDKIIVFDRTKENIKKYSGETPMANLVDKSFGETLKRILTMLGFMFIMTLVLTIVFVIGGTVSILGFALPFVFGLIAAIFSSVFITPLLWLALDRNIIKPKEKVKTKKQEPKTI